MRYKGFSIHRSDLTGQWWVQCGYDVLGWYKTQSGAKQSITKKWYKLTEGE